MNDRTQPTQWPAPEGSLSRPALADRDRFFDPGRSWCAAAAGHAQFEGGYPDPEAHSPFHECRTDRVRFDALLDLDGPTTRARRLRRSPIPVRAAPAPRSTVLAGATRRPRVLPMERRHEGVSIQHRRRWCAQPRSSTSPARRVAKRPTRAGITRRRGILSVLVPGPRAKDRTAKGIAGTACWLSAGRLRRLPPTGPFLPTWLTSVGRAGLRARALRRLRVTSVIGLRPTLARRPACPTLERPRQVGPENAG